MDKTLICIGGGELKTKETLPIDGYIAALAKKRAGDRRAYGLFIPTASHDSMPYFNSFRKTYTSVFDIKADVALTVYGEMSLDKIHEKFMKADFIYVGGGDTVFMLEHWKKSGMLAFIKEAYDRGVLICGLSAGAICWFETMYTDSKTIGTEDQYSLFPGLGWIRGTISPHYNVRLLDFDQKIKYNNKDAIGLEDCCAIEIVNGRIIHSIGGKGKAFYLFRNANNEFTREEILPRINV